MDTYLIKKQEIDEMTGLDKVHFLNDKAQRNNKSLGDLAGLTGFGFHLIEVPVGAYTTEFHVHHNEDECVYVLEGSGEAIIGDDVFAIAAGDFIGYRAGGLAHTIKNSGQQVLKCLVVGTRLEHDVADYPNLDKRLYRNEGQPWELVSHEHIERPAAGKK